MKSSESTSSSRPLIELAGGLIARAEFPGKFRLADRLGMLARRWTPEVSCSPVPRARVTVSLDDRIGRLMWAGAYERDLVRILRAVLKPGMTFVDVGAQIGYFSVLAAALVGESGHVYSFEPDPGCFSRLSRNASGRRNLELFNTAVADTAGAISFYRSPEQAESGWGAIFNEGEKRAEIRVAVCSLDGWAAEHRPGNVAFLKIDVEGAECRVLQGAKNLTAAARPILWVEANEECLARDGRSVMDLLRILGEFKYRPYGLADRGPQWMENIIALPCEQAELSAPGLGVRLAEIEPAAQRGRP